MMTSTALTKNGRIAAAVTMVGGTLVVGGQPVGAATLVVDSATDDGTGTTLREAIDAADDGDVITFDPSLSGSTIVLDPNSGGLGIPGPVNIVDDITITGLGQSELTITSTDGTVLYVYDTGSLTISDLTIENGPGHGIRVSDHNNLPFDASLDATRITIQGMNDHAVFVYSDSGDVSLTDVTFGANGRGGLYTRYVGMVSVTDSTITRNDGDGIYVRHASDVSIVGSTLSANDGNGASVAYFDALTISDSTLDDNDTTALDARNGTSVMISSDSTFSNSDGSGLYLYNMTGAVVLSDVTASGNSGDGASVRNLDDGVTITDAQFDGNNDDGFTLYQTGQGVSLQRVSANDNGRNGVELRQIGDDLTLDDVTADRNGRNGVYVYSVSGVVDLASISASGSADSGVEISNVGDVQIVGLDVVVAGDEGLYLFDVANVTIEDATVSSTGGDGIYIRYASNVDMSDVTIADSSADGLHLRDPSVVTLARVTVDGARDDGIYMYTPGSADITDTTVMGAFDDGIDIYSASGPISLDRVTVADSIDDGIRLARGTGNRTIVNSTIVGNGATPGASAIFISEQDLEVRHSTIAGNGVAATPAIEAYQANVTVDHSIVTGNTGGSPIGASPFSLGGGVYIVTNSVVPVGSGFGPTNVESDTAGLSPLNDLGGETPVAAPLPGSPAIDAGDPAIAGEPATDQRGGPRKIGTIDIGAVEVDGSGSVSVSDATVDENAGVVSVEVERTGSADFPVSVDLVTADGSATAGADFTAVDETIAFASGETGVKTVDIPIIVDTLAEAAETFAVNLEDAVDTTIGDGSATVTILDVPPPLAALSPERFADTRPGQSTLDGDFNGDGKLTAGGSYTVQIAGRGGVPADAKAATMNVTAIGAESTGFVTVHPCLATPPNASSLNYTAGVNLGNEVTVPLDADGKACFFTSGTVHLTVDVVAYVPDESRGFPVTPARLLDTRLGASTIDGIGAGRGKLPAGGSELVRVAGRGGVPADAAAVIVNVTGIGAESTGFVTVHPCLATPPNTSSLNVVTGVNRGNELVAEVDANGDICLFSSTAIHLTADVTGYVPSGTALNSVSPARLLDTRDSGDTVDGIGEGGGKPAAGSETTLQVSGRGGVPVGARAAIVNVTAIGPATNGFVTVHPCSNPRPTTAALNYVPGVNGGNEIVASLNAAGEICLFTSSSTHLAVDIVGYLA